ncbi:hypothetical protein RP20_CCG005701 [Aedes albopictus]|nr:hypothetical protein RP20_CCG005701 [Aedes albopictus]
MAVTSRNSSNHKPVVKRKRTFKQKSSQQRQRSKHVPTEAVQKRRGPWARAKQTFRRILGRQKTTPSPVENLPERHQTVLVDACNVGHAYPNQRGFSAEGVRLALQHFFNSGLEAYAMLPRFYLKPGKSSDWTILDMLYKNGRLITTPCKEFPMAIRGAAYDDRFMLDIATKFACVVVSNDQYRDIMHERPGWLECVRERRRGFQWNNDAFILS